MPTGLLSNEYFITVWTDSYNVILEESLASNTNPDAPSDIDNSNFKAAPVDYLGFPPEEKPPVFVPPSDLIVTNVVATEQAIGGETLTVSWTVENIEQGATTAPRWRDEVILSDSPVGTPGAKTWIIGSYVWSGPLGPGETYTTEITGDLSPAAEGTYVSVRTGIPIDLPPRTNETDSTNNVGETRNRRDAHPCRSRRILDFRSGRKLLRRNNDDQLGGCQRRRVPSLVGD